VVVVSVRADVLSVVGRTSSTLTSVAFICLATLVHLFGRAFFAYSFQFDCSASMSWEMNSGETDTRATTMPLGGLFEKSRRAKSSVNSYWLSLTRAKFAQTPASVRAA
jgi:hypothetical protein